MKGKEREWAREPPQISIFEVMAHRQLLSCIILLLIKKPKSAFGISAKPDMQAGKESVRERTTRDKRQQTANIVAPNNSQLRAIPTCHASHGLNMLASKYPCDVKGFSIH